MSLALLVLLQLIPLWTKVFGAIFPAGLWGVVLEVGVSDQATNTQKRANKQTSMTDKYGRSSKSDRQDRLHLEHKKSDVSV